jgi:vancomycin resistance protein YoaR
VASRKRSRGRQRAIIAVATLAAVFLLLTAVGLARGGGDGIPQDVRVEGVAVGGLPEEVALDRVGIRAREMLEDETVITVAGSDDYSRTVARRQLLPQARLKAAVEEAADQRGLVGRVLSGLGVGGTREVPLRFEYDPQRLDRLVDEIGGEAGRRARNATLRVTDAGVAFSRAEAGEEVPEEQIRQALDRFPPAVELVPVVAEPAVGDAAARAAQRRAQRLVATPPTVILGRTRAALTATDIRDALGFRPEPPALRVRLDPEVLRERLGPAFSAGEREAVDAQFEVVGAGVRVVPSRNGRAVDMERLSRTLVARAGRPATGARFTTAEPDRTTAEARALRITRQVSSFTTPYQCCQTRVTNIQRGAALLDGTIIPPGGSFSLNEALGERTTERGFVAAGQIVDGRLEDAIGGGVSQIATTVYNAAFFAGMDLVAHTPHEFYISRYPEGREATVSWGGPELIFRNDWDAGVLMKAFAGDTGITVTLYSAPLGRRVETETGPRTDPTTPKTIQTRNSSLPPGTRVVKQELGGGGFTVGYTRKVYAGDELKRDETYTWRYSPQNAYVEVGPPKAPTPRPGAGGGGRDTPDADGGGSTTPAEPAPDSPESPIPPSGG